MPIIHPENRGVRTLKGVHLFHSGFSNCSQRVRLVLEEKMIVWESHKIELMDLEHLTEEYQGIHPNGVVPALVYDGIVIVESNDIILYLDKHFGGEPLMPKTEEGEQRLRPWMRMNSELQPAIKTLTYDRILRKKYPPTPEKFEYYKKHQKNQDLVEFWRQFLQGFDPVLLLQYEEQCKNFLSHLNEALASSSYLTGDEVSLADFSTVVNVHRTGVLGINLGGYQYTMRWYKNMRQRPSFEKAILAYVPD